MAVENTLHDKNQIHLGPPASLHGGRGGNDEEREGEKLRNAVLWLGVGSQRGMAGQTRHSPSPSDPLSESVAVLASEQVSPPPQPHNRTGPVPDWGQLVAAEGEKQRRRRWGC